MEDILVRQIVSVFIFIFGAVNLLYPKLAFEIRKKWSLLFGVKMTGNERTWQYYRLVGLILMMVAVSLWFK